LLDSEYFKAREYILTALVYKKTEANREDWIWKITFTHPVANDHVISYIVDDKGKIIVDAVTE
jgi:hypothetical protein